MAPLNLDLVRRRRQPPEEKRTYKNTSTARRPSGSGLLLVGEKGSFFSENDYGAEHTLLPKDKFKEVAKPKADPAALAGAFQGIGRGHQGRRSDQGDVEFRLRRPAHRDRPPGRGRTQGRHRHRVGRRGHEGQERPVGRSVHPARVSQGILDPLRPQSEDRRTEPPPTTRHRWFFVGAGSARRSGFWDNKATATDGFL